MCSDSLPVSRRKSHAMHGQRPGKYPTSRSTEAAPETVPRMAATHSRASESTQLRSGRLLHDVFENQVKQLARSLHDEAGQMLGVVCLKLADLANGLPANQRAGVGELQEMVAAFEAELRRISHELRPMILDDFGLLPALEFLRKGVSSRTGMPVSIRSSFGGRLAPTLETALYRIVHESLRSASADGAARVSVSLLRTDTRIECSIRQEGPDTPHESPMRSMRARVEELGGTILVCSGPAGTIETRVSVPLSAGELAGGPDQGLTKPRRTA